MAGSEKKKFTDSLSCEQLEYIKKFNDELDKSPYDFIYSDREYVYSYRLKSDIDEGKKLSLFWITKDKNKFIIRIKFNPDDDEYSIECKIGKSGGEKYLAKYIIELCEYREKNKCSTNNPSLSKIEISSDEKVEKQQVEINKNNKFFGLVARAIQGRKIKYNSTSEEILVNEVVDFVMREISYDSIKKGKCKDIAEFRRYRYFRRYNSYTIFSVVFTLGYISSKKAEEIYYYFVSTKILDFIKLYEKIFNKEIIINSKDFIESLFQMLKTGTIDFSRCIGLNSNFSYVPEQTLVNAIDKYMQYCNY